MTRKIRNPISRAEDATDYVITTELFFCLLQLYLDFSNQRAGFELTAYYELYLDLSENKRVLNALFTPKSHLSEYLESYDFAYDIAHQKRIDHAQVALKAIQEDLHIYNCKDNIHEFIVPATMLKKIYQAYQILLHKNTTKFPLAWHRYHLAFLGDEPLMALEIYPVTDVESWMKGEVGGLQGYVTCDLEKDNLLDFAISTLPNSVSYIYKEHRKRQARFNQKIKKRS